MSNESQSGSARRLVQAFAGIHSTEDFIFFVAGSDRILALCRSLIEQYDQDQASPLVREVNGLCATQGVLPGALYGEVRKVVLALNRFHDAGGDHYGVLGLQPGASEEEIKQSYRDLSKKYHPDRQGPGGDARRFMEISGAYHALMAGTASRTASATPWRNRHPRRPGRRLRDQLLFFSGIIVLVALLAGSTVYLSAKHHQQALISQLRLNGTLPEQSDGETPGPTGKTAAPLPDDTENEQPSPAIEVEDAIVVDRTFAMVPEEPPPVAETRQPEPPPEEGTGHANPFAAEPALQPLPGPSPQTQPMRREAEVARTEDNHGSGIAVARPSAAPEAGEIREKKARIERINSSLEISALIKRYSTLYSDRNLPPFLALFADQAEENGQLIANLADKYRALFAHTRTIDLNINDITWSENRQGFQARGSFNAAYTYTDGKSSRHHGEIIFSMIKEQGELKIKSLDYAFD